MTEHGLGRLPVLDPRDQGHPLRRALAATVTRRTKYWALFSPPLDQNGYGTCVGHGWKHWMLCAPIRQTTPTAEPTAITLYREATHLDEWDGNEDDLQSGTSVRAGAKALQARGLLAEYGWCWDVDTAADWLSAAGPLVLGTSWVESFFDPEANGHIRWTPGSAVAGGHCYTAVGWDQVRGRIRCVNSWGSAWGQKGRFWIDGELLERLLAADGECCSALEIRRA